MRGVRGRAPAEAARAMIWRPLFSATVPFSSFSSRDVDLQVLEFLRVLFMLGFNLHKRWPTLLYKELLLSSSEANHCLTTDVRRRFYGCAFPLNLDSYSTCCGHFWWIQCFSRCAGAAACGFSSAASVTGANSGQWSPACPRGWTRQRCAEDPHALGSHVLCSQPQQIVPKALS